jgi:hypothetical protein
MFLPKLHSSSEHSNRIRKEQGKNGEMVQELREGEAKDKRHDCRETKEVSGSSSEIPSGSHREGETVADGERESD